MVRHYLLEETQALVVTALGTEKDAQMIDSLEGRIDDTFIFITIFHHILLEKLEELVRQNVVRLVMVS